MGRVCMIVHSLDNFIGVFDEVMPKHFCDDAIEYFEFASDLSLTYTRQDIGNSTTKSDIDDDTLFLVDDKVRDLMCANSNIYQGFQAGLNLALKTYVEEYSIINKSSFGFFTYRMQRTRVGAGFHVWHHENMRNVDNSRFLTAILYLNDIEEGGETEFLYIPRRIKPKAGRLVLFPSTFTHTHRGNPPLEQTKYIMTTWGQVL